MTAGPLKAKVECETSAARNRKLEVAAATCRGELSVLGQNVRLWKGRIAVSKYRANTAEDMTCNSLDKMSDLRSLVEELNRTIEVDCACVVRLVDG